MSKEYDFYSYGCKIAKDNQINLEKLLIEIEQRYGDKAKHDFYQGYYRTLSELLSRARKMAVENQVLQKDDIKNAETKYSDMIAKNGMIR